MSINLNRVFEAIASEKYNKDNLAMYIILMIVIAVLYLTVDYNKASSCVICLASFAALCIFQSGYYAITSYNEINNKNSVFPSLKDAGNIVFQGIKYLIGIFVLCIIAYLLPIIIVIACALLFIYGGMHNSESIMITGCILLLAAIILMFVSAYLYVIPLNIVYLKSLKYSDLFSIKNAVDFRKARKGEYNVFIGKAILLGLLICVIAIIITVIITAAAYFAYKDSFVNADKKYIKDLIASTRSTVVTTFQTVLYPNLAAQIANVTNKIKPENLETAENI